VHVLNIHQLLIDCALPISQFRSGACFSKTQAIAPQEDTDPRFKPKAIQKPFVPLQPTNTYKSVTNARALPQLQAVAQRQYPISTAKPHVDITDSFEDDGVPVGDRYKSTAGLKVDSSTESLWSVNWFVLPRIVGCILTTVERRKNTTKKNKTWDGDGMLHQKGNLVQFLSENGKKV
jgi:DNA repair and recombination protein RAD54B